MSQSSKVIRPLSLLLLVLLLLGSVACASNDDAVAKQPTPELAVVVFATEDPNAPTATPAAVPSPTAAVRAATPSATVDISAGNAPAVAPADSASSDYDALVAGRPADINPLTGLPVDDPARLERRPLMVRIGNDPGARPQVALNQADMVYEEIVEWWVTRFTAIYLSQDPEMIAPIRSARLINLQLVPQYQGALANSGGSDGVRWELSQTDIVNLDEFFVPGPYFYRPNQGWQTRLAFDATAARDYLADEGLESDVNLRGFFFSDQLDPQKLPVGVLDDAQEVVVPYPQQTSKTTWTYDDRRGLYLRQTLDQPHYEFSGNQVAAANVIVYFADHQPTDIVEDSNGATSIRILINGRGAAWLFRDGKIVRGNWETDGTATPKFVFDNGQAMPLKPGNTWVQVIPLEYFITVDGQEYSSLPDLSPSSEDESEDVDVEDDVGEAATETPAPTPTLTPIGARSP